MKSQQSGFTLVEIAIVLVIIGLLLGGILKGQELINSARVKNLANDFRVIPTYIYAYQDKFRALPGDDSAAATHVTRAVAPARRERRQRQWRHRRATGTRDHRDRSSPGAVLQAHVRHHANLAAGSGHLDDLGHAGGPATRRYVEEAPWSGRRLASAAPLTGTGGPCRSPA